MEDVIKDKRFAHIAKDPRFHRMPKGERKVKIDKRFKDMFKDKKFKLKYTVDARGRPVNVSTNENLKKFYELSDSGDSEESGEELDEEERSKDELKPRIQEGDSETSSESSDSDSDDKRFAPKGRKSSECTKSEGDMQSKLDKHKKKNYLNKKQNKKNEIKLTSIKEKGNEKTNSEKKKEKRKEKGNSKKGDKTGSDDDEEKTVKANETKANKANKKVEQLSEKNKEVDYARGEGFLESSSSDSDDDDDDDSDGSDSTEFDHKWNEQDSTAVEVSEATCRLAVCNMDWDRIKARDIFFLLSSFKPPQGLVKAVKVYPSEFGKERMAQERLEGPKELKQLKKVEEGKEEEEELDKDGSRFQTEKLRQYQLLRLKYYYAVAEFDSATTADQVYKECDGKEYETSSTKLDLRFIPDDMVFEDEPTSVCTDIPVDYKPNLFFNTALSQSKVDLTWDETDRDRTHKIARQFEPKGEDLEEDDLNAYLASSSDEEGVDYGNLVQQSSSDEEQEEDDNDDEGEEAKEEKQISKYKMLLQEIDSEEKKKKDMDVQMEITWEPGLKEVTEEIVKKKSEKKKGEGTVWEDYLARKKEKKKKKELDKKHQRLLQHAARAPGDDEDDDDSEGEDNVVQEGEQAFSDDELPAGVDLEDDFFDEDSKGGMKSKKADKKKKKKKKKLQAEETEEEHREKEALSLLMAGEEEEKRHFSLKKLVDQEKKKKKNKKNKNEQKGDQLKPSREDDFKIDVEDPRFSAMYDSHLFNLDPSAPEFRKTKGTEALVEEKLKRSKKKGNKTALQGRTPDTSSAKKQKIDNGEPVKKDESLASLVNSIKMKTKHFKGSKSKV